MARIVKNSAKCTACGIEIESVHRHDFKVHFCEKEPTPSTKWSGEGKDMVLVEDPGKFTWRFAVDGGREYLRRMGFGWTDTSEYKDE